MLKWRLISAIILIPLVYLGLFLPSKLFALLTAAIWLVGMHEWLNFYRFPKLPEAAWLVIFTLSLFCLYYTANILWVVLAAVSWAAPASWLVTYRTTHAPKLLKTPLTGVLSGIWFLGMSWVSLQILHHHKHGPSLILLLLLIVWATDIGAYIAGRAWGKKLLASKISPKKTYAGLWGGLICALVVSTLCWVLSEWRIWSALPDTTYLTWMIVTALISLIAVIGDLFESMVKRIVNVKDSGKLIPGHGGLLDRIDSLISSLPFYVLAFNYFL